MNGPVMRRAAWMMCSRPTAAMVRGVRMPYAFSVSYCSILEISRRSARLSFTTRRPWESSQRRTPPVSSAAYRWLRVCEDALMLL